MQNNSRRVPRLLSIMLLISASLLVISFILYSYTQVDLNLTLSSNPTYQSVQSLLTQIGYYNRPLSSGIFVSLSFLWLLLYLGVLFLVSRNYFSIATICFFIGVVSLFVFAYPAFSHDIFNYMFDARILTKYGLDPRFFKALDFPADSWTRFMHWTHRYYPYGPLWLLISIVPSFAGFGKFVLTLFFFKCLFLLFHIGNCYVVYQIVLLRSPKTALWALSFYALNPLVMIESVLSPHNEVMMTFFTLVGIWAFFKNKKIISVFALFIGAGVKFLSGGLIPFIYFLHPQKNNRILIWCLLAWIVFLIPVIRQREAYAWYFIPIVALTALSCERRVLTLFVLGASFALSIQYWPFLLFGTYQPHVYLYENISLIVATLAAFVLGFIFLHDKYPR